MAEEEKRPALKEIPVREMKSSYDSERQIISLMNSLKDNFDAKLTALRKDLEQKTREQVTNEIIKIKDEIEKLKVDNKEVLDKLQTDNDEARKAITDQITELSEKLDSLASAPPDENEKFKEEVQATLDKVQALTSKFDLTLFVNEIRESFASKLEQAEKKAKDLADRLEKGQFEVDKLKKDMADKEQQAKQEIEQLKRELATQDTDSRPAPASSPAPTPMSRIPPASSPSYLQRKPSPISERETQGEDGKKTVQYCKNCGKTRNRSSARFCIYCGSEF